MSSSLILLEQILAEAIGSLEIGLTSPTHLYEHMEVKPESRWEHCCLDGKPWSKHK